MAKFDEKHRSALSESLKGRFFSEQHRKRISDAAKRRFAAMTKEERQTSMAPARERTNAPDVKAKRLDSNLRYWAEHDGPNKGKKFSDESRENMSVSQRRRLGTMSPEERSELYGTCESHTEKTKAKMSESAKQLWRDMPAAKRAARSAAASVATKESWAMLSSDERQARSASRSREAKRFWANATPEQRRARLSAARKACHSRKTKIEAAVELLLNELGVQFAYQYEIGRFVVDFYIPSRMLIIECDGTYWHSRPGAKEHDEARDTWLLSAGYRILRLPEADIRRLTPMRLSEQIA